MPSVANGFAIAGPEKTIIISIHYMEAANFGPACGAAAGQLLPSLWNSPTRKSSDGPHCARTVAACSK